MTGKVWPASAITMAPQMTPAARAAASAVVVAGPSQGRAQQADSPDVFGAPAAWLAGATIALLSVVTLYLSVFKPFDHDELEAVHTAWKVWRGDLIYVDFFQHHHPLLYGYLSWVIAAVGERATAVVACRLAMLPFLAGTVAATYVLGARVFGKSAAVLGVILLLSSRPFINKAVEMRPDSPEVMFGLVALAMLFSQSKASPKAAALRQVLIGLCLGIAFLFLQKAVFPMAAVGAVVVWRIWKREERWTALVGMAGGFAIALVPFVMWLAGHQMLREYLFLNWTLNAHFLHHFGFGSYAEEVYRDQPLTIAFAAVACAGLLPDPRQRQLAALTALVGVSLIVVRMPYVQDWLPVLPLVALLAGHGLISLFARRRAMLFILTSLSVVMPILALRGYLPKDGTNRKRLERIQYVVDATDPRDTVYDGNAIFNLFRGDVDYFWFSLAKDESLQSYKSLRAYEYDVYERIDAAKPKIISTYGIDNLDDPRIRDHYARSDKYDDLWIRTR